MDQTVELKKKRRFKLTVIEVGLVVSIIATLAAVAVPNFKASRERANGRATLASAKTLIGAVEMYNLDKNIKRTVIDGQFLAALKSGGYLQSIPQDPGRGPGTNARTIEVALAMQRGDQEAVDRHLRDIASGVPPATPDVPVPEASSELPRNEATLQVQGLAGGPVASVPPSPPPLPSVPGTERYAEVGESEFKRVAAEPLSTFAIDVDTASYANVRRFLQSGQRPPRDAVRIEELVNYFPYDDAPPDGAEPFAVHTEVVASPWDPTHRLVRIGVKGKVIDARQRPPSNLVFLVDVSGSMDSPERLPLVVRSLKMLTDELQENDRVAIVVYAGSSGLVLPSTSGLKKDAIRAVFDNLRAGGSTNGAGGIQQAYQVAQASFIKTGVNRVILCTDGDFNVGVSSTSELAQLAEEKARSGVFLSVLGFGMGNYQDENLERLADRGNGNYAYIDGELEARKVLVEQMAGTLVTIAKDVKIQVEFNPAQVAAYRLIGYENRSLAAADFNDDKKDAGELGAGHSVTALYDVVPVGVPVERGVDPLRYQVAVPVGSRELLTVKLRFKAPDGDTSKLIAVPLTDRGAPFANASENLRFGAAVASFGMLLRGSQHAGRVGFSEVDAIARGALGHDREGHRRGFLELAAQARAVTAQP